MLEANEILNASILVVDDEEVNVELIEEMLHNDGYLNVKTTRKPAQVCALHAEHRFDLILLDMQMPEMDGFEVIEALKAAEQSSYVPVLVLTAQPAHKLRALKAGAKDFVSKPFDFFELQTRIRNMLEVRLLYRKLGEHNRLLEQTVLERTAELRLSEARFQRFAELSSDWYWEQDASGALTYCSGRVEELLGPPPGTPADAVAAAGWDLAERALLDEKIANREPFLEFVYHRRLPDGRVQTLQVSGEPMFNSASAFTGYRGVGQEIG